MKLLLLIAFSFMLNVSYSQNWNMVNTAHEHNIGISLNALRTALNGQSVNSAGLGISFMGQRFSTYEHPGGFHPWNDGYLSYEGRLGVITEGTIDGQRFVDAEITLEAGNSGLIILPVSAHINAYTNQLSQGIRGGFGYSVGGASADGRTFSGTLMLSMGGQSRNSFLESVEDVEMIYTSYQQKPDSRIKTDSEMTASELFNQYPEEFETHQRVKSLNLFEELKNTQGFRADIQTSLIPLKGGLITIGGLLTYGSSSSSKLEIENELKVEQGTETTVIDGVSITRDKFLHSGAVVNKSVDSGLSYKRIDLSMNLGYQKGRMRIWLSPNYSGETYKIVNEALNIENTREAFGVQLGVALRGFYR